MPDTNREMYHQVHGVCYMTLRTMQLDATSDDITRTYVELPGGEIIEVSRCLLSRNCPAKAE